MSTRRVRGTVLAVAAIAALAAAALAAPDAATGTAAEIERLEGDLARAIVANDVEALRRIQAATYVYTDSDGRVSGREDFIRAYQAGTRIRSLAFDDLVVDAYPDAAVVRGVLTIERVTDGVPIRRVARYTRVYVRFPQGWQAVAGHSSEMKAPAGKGAR